MTRVVDKKAYFDKIGYVPHSPGQWSFHTSNARFKVPVCGRRYGKSTMAGKDVQPKLLIPNQKWWIVGPTYDLGEKEFRVIWDDMIRKLRLGQDKRVKKAYNKKQGDMRIEFPWNTSIEVRSADHADSLVGEGLHGVIMSEAAKHKRETWERYIRAALADFRGEAMFPTTPEGHNWLYNLWMLGHNAKFPDYQAWRFPSWENPHVYPGGREDEEIKLLEATTTPEWFMQEIGADFSSFVGRIYSEFDDVTHVRNCSYNPAWPNYIGMDWGYVNPFAAIEFQVDPQDNIWVWREHYQSYRRLEEHLEKLAARVQPEDYKITCCYGDAADPEATMTVNQKFAPCLSMPEAKQNWREGIDTVKGFLKLRQTGLLDEYGTPHEEPKLYVDPSCVNTIREFNNYRAPDEVKSNVRESASAGAAQKQDDHAMDAIRYALVHLFVLGAQRHLSEIYGGSDLVVSTSSGGASDLTLAPTGSGGYFSSETVF